MFKYLFWAIAFYLIIRFIFNFVIPVFRATRQMKSQMREFQERMHGQQPEDGFAQPPSAEKHHEPIKKGDYIDFEEIK
jgi:hypothetical protein